jgi:hypothetical protein
MRFIEALLIFMYLHKKKFESVLRYCKEAQENLKRTNLLTHTLRSLIQEEALIKEETGIFLRI